MIKTSQEAGAALRALRLAKGLHEPYVQRTARVASLARVEGGLASIGDMDSVARTLGTTLFKVMNARTPVRPPPLPTPDKGDFHLPLEAIAQCVLNLPDGGSKVERVTDAVVLCAIERAAQNQSAAARLLGMERKAFVRRFARARRAAKKSKAKR